eukprot:TRINITY_DN57_c0_g1_i2.p1 TRINITY_DN57_c0_g1~~TRINITY_DN57_c0_g1_i2.p1  ORF type:complete len:1050 (-),score=289.09 TRINITY_DN57_c0_g1_i2:428-3367(-)
MELTGHQKKRIKLIKNRGGGSGESKEDAFASFLTSTTVRCCRYADTNKVMGRTFGMCVLQDFEAMTPNLLARTVETVEGGGLVVILIKTLHSLRQLYALSMDAHKRFRTESHTEVVGRFNERFLLSLAACNAALVLDDELNVLPVSSHSRTVEPLPPSNPPAEAPALTELKASLKDTQPAGSLVRVATTVDQAKAVLTFVDAVAERTLHTTVTLTAARGRGKSAALGLAIASAVALGYSNIFVTSPSPENLKTLFEFLLRGLDALGFKEHGDYDLVQATNPALAKAIVRVNIFRAHRQTVQYIAPTDAHKLGQAELVVIDEAAAIPLPLVKALLGPYLVFLSSTVNGYEGTGRSLSLKLIKQLREESAAAVGSSTGRVLREVLLEEPIRYASGDKVEGWLNKLLCLEATSQVRPLVHGCPNPADCQLFYVSRDALFSFHDVSEKFLQQMMALFVASHYKNSPNDLQLLSDAPAHHIFVLLGPVLKPDEIPDILCAVQVSLEGEISRESVEKAQAHGLKAAGDLIPWTVSQQFQDADFPMLSGARVVRIATHPDHMHMGYASRTLEQLKLYFQGDIPNLDEVDADAGEMAADSDELDVGLDQELHPRSKLPPLLLQLSQRKPEHLHYLGVSYGLSHELLNFWMKNDFSPVYLRQVASDITGEYSCIMLKALRPDAEAVGNAEWLRQFVDDFRVRFCHLLAYEFRSFSPALALRVALPTGHVACSKPLGRGELAFLFSEFDLRRLRSYAANLVDYHVVMDLVPRLGLLVFCQRLEGVQFMASQLALLAAVALQCRTLESVADELHLEINQVMALFNKCVRKIVDCLAELQEQRTADELCLPTAEAAATKMRPLAQTVDEDLAEAQEDDVKAKEKDGAMPVDPIAAAAGDTVGAAQLARQLHLAAFKIDEAADFDRAMLSTRGVPNVVSIASRKRAAAEEIRRQRRAENQEHAADLPLSANPAHRRYAKPSNKKVRIAGKSV